MQNSEATPSPGDGAMRDALVTGSSSGIGLAVTKRLLDNGWTVTGVDRTPAALDHPRLTPASIDLLNADEIDALLPKQRQVCAIIHAAGFMRTAPLGNLDFDEGEVMWRLHVAAATRLVNGLAPFLPDGSRIVLIGSRTAAGAAERSQYAATKAALTGLSRSWAIELAPRQITVNVISPAATDTPMLTDPARGAVRPRLPPMGRFVRPEEIAGLVAFLLSDDGTSITGQNLVVCGGASL